MSVWKNCSEWFHGLINKQNMDIVVVGLKGSGKTSLVNVLVGKKFTDLITPTYGYVMNYVNRGRFKLRIKDLSGDPSFTRQWKQHSINSDAIVFVVDFSNEASITNSRAALKEFLDKPVLQGIPVLVVASKSDKEDELSPTEISQKLALSEIHIHKVDCISCSAKKGLNTDHIIRWLYQAGLNMVKSHA